MPGEFKRRLISPATWAILLLSTTSFSLGFVVQQNERLSALPDDIWSFVLNLRGNDVKACLTESLIKQSNCREFDISCLCLNFQGRDKSAQDEAEMRFQNCFSNLEPLFPPKVSRTIFEICAELLNDKSEPIHIHASENQIKRPGRLRARVPQELSTVWVSVTIFYTSTITSLDVTQYTAKTGTRSPETTSILFDSVCPTSYIECPRYIGLSFTGGCCPPGFDCATALCTRSVYQQSNCGANSYLCPDSMNFGCCESGLLCGTFSCYPPPSIVTSQSVVSALVTQTLNSRTLSSSTSTSSNVPISSPKTPSDSGSSSKTRAIAFGVAVPLFVLVVVVGIFFFFRYRKRRAQSSPEAAQSATTESHELKDTSVIYAEADSGERYELGDGRQAPEMRDTFGYHAEADSTAIHELNEQTKNFKQVS